jgi:hypothetical protein
MSRNLVVNVQSGGYSCYYFLTVFTVWPLIQLFWTWLHSGGRGLLIWSTRGTCRVVPPSVPMQPDCWGKGDGTALTSWCWGIEGAGGVNWAERGWEQQLGTMLVPGRKSLNVDTHTGKHYAFLPTKPPSDTSPHIPLALS